MPLNSGPCNEPSYLPSVVFSEVFAEARQSFFRVLKFIRRALPRPINVVVANPNQNQIGESVVRQQLTDLPGKIAGAKDFAEEIWSIFPIIGHSAQPTVFSGHEWCELFQPFENAVNTRWRGLAVEKPIIAVSRSRAPKCA